MKGYIRDYSFNGINALGFRTPVGLTITAGLVIVSVITVVYMQVKDRDIKRGAAGLIYTSVFAGVVTILILKSLNLAAAVEPGQYQIFGGSSSFGIEARMKGFEDYKIGFGNAAPTDFTITPDGDHYLITMDSYGITKTLCILEGNLMAGNYEQSEPAHLWDIEAVSGTPYFTIVNVETGYAVAMDDDGMLELIAGGADDDRCLMRIGAENIEYYERLASQDEDMSAAVITLDDEVPYSGNAVYPSNVTVELNGQMLEEGIDYELYFWDNYIPGTAHVTVTGIGDHSGSTGADYEIIYNDFELDDPFNRNTSDYIIRMYRMAFMRLPSIEEVKSWSVALTADNRTPDSVVWEAYWSGGLCHSNASFVEAVYRLMLLRNGSRAELRNWINELDNGATREAVIGEISASPDYQNIWHNFGIGFR